MKSRRRPDLLLILVLILTAGVALTSLEAFLKGMDVQAFPRLVSKTGSLK